MDKKWYLNNWRRGDICVIKADYGGFRVNSVCIILRGMNNLKMALIPQIKGLTDSGTKIAGLHPNYLEKIDECQHNCEECKARFVCWDCTMNCKECQKRFECFTLKEPPIGLEKFPGA